MVQHALLVLTEWISSKMFPQKIKALSIRRTHELEQFVVVQPFFLRFSDGLLGLLVRVSQYRATRTSVCVCVGGWLMRGAVRW